MEEWKRRAFGDAFSYGGEPAPEEAAPAGGQMGAGLSSLASFLPAAESAPAGGGSGVGAGNAPLLAHIRSLGIPEDSDEFKLYASMANFMGGQNRGPNIGHSLGEGIAQGLAAHVGFGYEPTDYNAVSPQQQQQNALMMKIFEGRMDGIQKQKQRQTYQDAARSLEQSYMGGGSGSPAPASGALPGQAPSQGPSPGPGAPSGGQDGAEAASVQQTAAALPGASQSLFAQHVSQLRTPQARSAYSLAVRTVIQQTGMGNIKDASTLDKAYEDAVKLDIEIQKHQEAIDPQQAARMAYARTSGAERAKGEADIEADVRKKTNTVGQIGQLYDSLEALGNDPDLEGAIGPIQASDPGRLATSVWDPKAATVQTKVASAQHTMELIMTRLMMSGQGQITEGERKLIKDAIGNVSTAGNKGEYLERVRYARELMTTVFGMQIPSQYSTPSRSAEMRAKTLQQIEIARQADPRNARAVRAEELAKTVNPRDQQTLAAKARELAADPEKLEALKEAFDRRYGAGSAEHILGGSIPQFSGPQASPPAPRPVGGPNPRAM